MYMCSTIAYGSIHIYYKAVAKLAQGVSLGCMASTPASSSMVYKLMYVR